MLQRSSVQKNVYQSTDPPSIEYKELESSDNFLSTFSWAQKLSQGHFRFNYRQGKANGAADALSH